MDKQKFRVELKNRLSQMSEADKKLQSQNICSKLTQMPEFKKAGLIMIFLSLPHEVDTTPIILCAWQQGKSVSVPKVSWQQRHMLPVQINSLETGFSTDGYGLKNPVTGVPVPLEDIDLVITPGLGFDKKGNRLGRGGGYFDRFFSNENLKAKKCAICFSQQVIDHVPTDDHDVPIDCLISDNMVMRFK